jgi:4-amino-4-deoxy-L-arabinose transferase-like glycosyltransferase
MADLGERSLLGDEATYANPGREAAIGGHWYPLVVRGALYRSKPPLCVWPVALSFRWFGVDETADRLPSALAGAALAGLVYAFAAWLLGRWTGLLAAALLATCRPWLFRHGVREGVGDPLLCLLIASTLLLYLRYRTTGRRRWLLAAAAAAALSGLVKDLVGPLLLLAVLAGWELARRPMLASVAPAAPAAGSPLLSRLRAPFALVALALVPYLLWFLDSVRRDRSFLPYEYRNLVVRNTHGLAAVHVHGIGYYPAVLYSAFGIWWWAILPAALAWAELRRQGGPRERAFLLLPVWAVVVIAALMLSASSLSWYLDPSYPAIAVLIAAGCGELGRRLGRRRALRAAFALTLAGLVVARASVAREMLSRDVPKSQVHQFVLAFRRLPDAHLYVAGGLEPPGTLVREWNRFYLDQLAAIARPLPATLPAGSCSIVLTAAPGGLAGRPSFAGAPILSLATSQPDEAPLAILDLCGGELVRRLPLWSHASPGPW